MNYHKAQTFVFYTETKEGVRTVTGEQTCKEPKRTKLYKNLEKQGFTNGVQLYGFATKEEFLR